MSDDYLADVCQGKTGKELFRELLRLYSEAQVEDYYKMGQWQDRAIKTDYVLIDAHRREAGAPAPPPLESIPEPEIPAQRALTLPGITGFNGNMMSGMSPALKQLVANSAQQAGPATELRNCAIFISRNKLDPSRAKAMLMSLSVEDRKTVTDGFTSEKIGMEATDDLERYIKETVKPGVGPAKAVPPAAGKVVPPAAKAVPPPKAGDGAVTATGSFGAEELKQTAMFIAKNKLDPTRAKTALMKLTADQRAAVIRGFSSALTGVAATAELEAYIESCEESGFGDGAEEPPSKRARAS